MQELTYSITDEQKTNIDLGYKEISLFEYYACSLPFVSKNLSRGHLEDIEKRYLQFFHVRKTLGLVLKQ